MKGVTTKLHTPVNIEERQGLQIQPGDTVRVWQKIVEDKNKTRLQPFEGIVLARKHGNEPGATFTVRRVVDGVGVEKIFPLYSPMIDRVEILRRTKVRRSKLYYIRDKAASEIRRQMRRLVDLPDLPEPAPQETDKSMEETNSTPTPDESPQEEPMSEESDNTETKESEE